MRMRRLPARGVDVLPRSIEGFDMQIVRSALIEHAAEDMFDIIEQAEHYPAFLPWCAEVTILARDERLVVADIGVAWHGVRFRMRTRNPKGRPDWLSVRLESGPFRRFDGDWSIRALTPSACKIEFALHCEVDSRLLRAATGIVAQRLAGTFVDAFISRAEALHGLRREPA